MNLRMENKVDKNNKILQFANGGVYYSAILNTKNTRFNVLVAKCIMYLNEFILWE